MISQAYQRAWKGVISPSRVIENYRSYYNYQKQIKNGNLELINFDVVNINNKNIKALIIKKKNAKPQHSILYLHGNGGNKFDAFNFIPILKNNNNLALIAFDCIGCGSSQQGYLTYGIEQSDDLEYVLRKASNYIPINKLSIWGRSMGALTAIIYSTKQQRRQISSIVLDSPFVSLQKAVKSVINKQIGCSNMIKDLIFYFIKKQVNERVSHKIFELDYLSIFQRIKSKIPILFFYSESDHIATPQEVRKLYDVYPHTKQLLEIFHDHQEDRSLNVYDEGMMWIINHPLPQKRAKISLTLIS